MFYVCYQFFSQKECGYDFYLSEHVISVCDKTKYLGHFITNQMTDDDDDDDMYRQRRVLCAQADILVRKFHTRSDAVKVKLFRAYCTPLYSTRLWVKFKKASFQKLQVAYNDCMRILMNKQQVDQC